MSAWIQGILGASSIVCCVIYLVLIDSVVDQLEQHVILVHEHTITFTILD